ncbi:hypothetical protein Dimus_016145, partial [Dionaea muscipula]
MSAKGFSVLVAGYSSLKTAIDPVELCWRNRRLRTSFGCSPSGFPQLLFCYFDLGSPVARSQHLPCMVDGCFFSSSVVVAFLAE